MSVQQREKNNIQTKRAALQLLALAYDTLHTYFHAARLASAIWDAGYRAGGGGTTKRRKKLRKNVQRVMWKFKKLLKYILCKSENQLCNMGVQLIKVD
jgi:hypothetical protein